MTAPAPTLDLMVRYLATTDVDLANEVACMVKLMQARFTAGEIRQHLSDAIERAKAKRTATRFQSFTSALFGRA